ncbi:hypothetical protein D3C72_1087180 [compost metagenome]
MHVDVVGVDVDVAQALDQELHRLVAVVDVALQHALVADVDAAVEEHVHRLLGDPGDLVGVVEVRVEGDLLAQLLAERGHFGQGVEPGGVRDDLHRHHGRALGGEADAADVGEVQQRLADVLEVGGRQLVHVATRDDDVLELGAAGDILVDLGPALGRGQHVDLLDLLGVGADGVGAGAEAAVHGADVERQEERLVHVAVGQALHGGVVHLVERVEAEHRVVRQQARA